MKVIKAFPPNYSDLSRAFPFIRGKRGILFSWGPTLFNPSGLTIPPWLIAHEEVHGGRMGGMEEFWWERYINNDKFRKEEEVLAHRAEWQAYSRLDPDRDWYLESLGKRLSSPLYDLGLTVTEAKRLIGEKE